MIRIPIKPAGFNEKVLPVGLGCCWNQPSCKLQGLGCCTTQQSTARGQPLAYTSRRYKNLGVCSQKKDINQLMFFLLKKNTTWLSSRNETELWWHHLYMILLFCPFFLNKHLQTKSVDVKLPLYNLEFETHLFAFLPRMQSWPPRRMYKYDQVCLRKCRLRGSKNSKMYPNLEWLVLLVQFSGWYLHHNDPQQTLERGARVWFFLPLAKWAIFFGVMKPTPLDSERLLWWTCDCWCSPLKRAWLEIFANAWFDFFAGNGSISQLGEVGKFIGTQKFRIGNGICDRSQEVIKSTWRPPSKSTNVSSFLVVLRNL